LVSPTKDWINCARAKAGLGLFPSPVRKAGLGPPIRHATPLENVKDHCVIAASITVERTTAEWLALFQKLDIAAMPVNSIEDPIQSRHL
jgi:hypothetical protein